MNKIGFERLIIISNVLFCLLFVVLCINNRPATDDFHFLDNIHKHGILGGVAIEYETWSPRWVSVFITHVFLWLHEQTGLGLLLFGLISLCLIILSMFLFLKNISALFSLNGWTHKDYFSKNKTTLSITIFAVSILFLSTFRIGELWFWLCSASTYLWSNSLLLLGISQLISSKKNFKTFLIVFFSFLYIGGSCGPLSLITLLILFILGLSSYFGVMKIPNKLNFLIKTSLGFATCLFAFVLLYMADGNSRREEFFKEISIGYSFILNFKMTAIILLKRIPFSLLIGLIFCSPLLLLEQKKGPDFLKKLIIATVVYCSFVFLFQWSITYKTQDVAAYRTLFFINVITLFYSAAICLLISPRIQLMKKIVFVEFTLALFAVSFVFGVLLYSQSILTGKYAEAFDQRVEFVKSHCKDKTAIIVDPLPQSGLLYSAELSKDPFYFSNQHFKEGLRLDCQIQLKE